MVINYLYLWVLFCFHFTENVSGGSVFFLGMFGVNASYEAKNVVNRRKTNESNNRQKWYRLSLR